MYHHAKFDADRLLRYQEIHNQTDKKETNKKETKK